MTIGENTSLPKETLTFLRFPDLPAELRVMIWSYCLPHRVVELDLSPQALLDPVSCGLLWTSTLNGLPPLISRVCRESRAVALQSRPKISETDDPAAPLWKSGSRIWQPIDPLRDIFHLNWEPGWPTFHPRESSFFYLAWHAARVARGGSFMLNNLRFIEEHEKDALKKMPSWIVVVRTIVIHASYRYAASTGLFGLLGDAPVQLVYVSEQDKVRAFLSLAEESQRKGHAFHPQNLRREFTKNEKDTIRWAISSRHLRESMPPIRTAIMFRLCTEMCNHSDMAEEGFRPPPDTNPPAPPRNMENKRGPSGQYLRDRGRFFRYDDDEDNDDLDD